LRGRVRARVVGTYCALPFFGLCASAFPNRLGAAPSQHGRGGSASLDASCRCNRCQPTSQRASPHKLRCSLCPVSPGGGTFSRGGAKHAVDNTRCETCLCACLQGGIPRSVHACEKVRQRWCLFLAAVAVGRESACAALLPTRAARLVRHDERLFLLDGDGPAERAGAKRPRIQAILF